MPEWLTNLGGITDVVGKIFGTGYNIYTNQRDFEYQKDLQQQIFNREDNAVQRRMADLQAAGLNPNLAAGSAAQAGAVVSRSSTNDLNIGSMLDTVNALQQYKAARQQTENAKKESEILDYEKIMAKIKANNDKLNYRSNVINTLASMGIPVEVTTKSDDYLFDAYVPSSDDRYTPYSVHSFKAQKDMNDYNANILKSDSDWATAGKFGQLLSLIIKAFK